MAPVAPLPGVDLATLRARKLEATQHLLGATIAVADEEWQEPVALPGWTRAHVGTHVARNADGIRRLVGNALHGTHDPMYPGDRDEEIERGSERAALDLQIDLDTSAGLLNQAFDKVTDEGTWRQEVELRGGLSFPLHQLPVARLFEVAIHHVDLQLAYTIDAMDDELAGWLLQWAATRARQSATRLDARLVPSVGEPLEVGNASLATVTGSPQAILGWLTGRPAEPVSGASHLTPPPL